MSRHHRRHRVGGPRWQRFARQVKDRDGWRCQSCGRAGRLEVDHVVPLEAGGAPWDPANCQTLCHGCHAAKTRAERRRPEPPDVARWRALVDRLADPGERHSARIAESGAKRPLSPPQRPPEAS